MKNKTKPGRKKGSKVDVVKKYLLGYEPTLLYGKDDKNGNARFVELMTIYSATQEKKKFGQPDKVKIYRIIIEEF